MHDAILLGDYKTITYTHGIRKIKFREFLT